MRGLGTSYHISVAIICLFCHILIDLTVKEVIIVNVVVEVRLLLLVLIDQVLMVVMIVVFVLNLNHEIQTTRNLWLLE